jgi:hypothetical protein
MLAPAIAVASVPRHIAGVDEREQLGSKTNTPLQKFAVSLLTYDISTIDHA